MVEKNFDACFVKPRIGLKARLFGNEKSLSAVREREREKKKRDQRAGNCPPQHIAAITQSWAFEHPARGAHIDGILAVIPITPVSYKDVPTLLCHIAPHSSEAGNLPVQRYLVIFQDTLISHIRAFLGP